MDTQHVKQALQALRPDDMDWKFALYSTHKSRDGLELEWNLCEMQGISNWIDTLKTNLLDKTTVEKTVAEYSPFLSDKESIAALERTSDLIKNQMHDILLNIENGVAHAPEDFASGAISKTVGYAFYGTQKNADGELISQVLFMRRGNPFLGGNRVRLCTTCGSQIVNSDKPLLKFSPATDFLLIGDVCYFISAAIEKDFELENRHLAIASKRLGNIADADIVSDYEKLEQAAMKASNAKKFTDFNKQILAHIVRLGIVEREEFLSTYGVTIDNNGRIDTFDAEQCELIIDLLCCRSCLDPLGRLSVGNNISPRE